MLYNYQYTYHFDYTIHLKQSTLNVILTCDPITEHYRLDKWYTCTYVFSKPQIKPLSKYFIYIAKSVSIVIRFYVDSWFSIFNFHISVITRESVSIYKLQDTICVCPVVKSETTIKNKQIGFKIIFSVCILNCSFANLFCDSDFDYINEWT